mmetsp:Transcript_22324/g.75146  ORF Transcript_22324/g.75146 Transcript_22324/m.75146 type:complete len:446 (-) Transcript_22324:374-1711(-)
MVDELVADAQDLRDLLSRAESARLRRVLGDELDTIASNLRHEHAELKRLLGLAGTDYARSVLTQALERLSFVADGKAGSLAAPPADRGALPSFCFVPAHGYGPALERVPGSDRGAIQARLKAGEPFIIAGSSLCGPAVGRWDLAFLGESFGDEVKCVVYESHDRAFRYWDPEKNVANYEFREEEHTRRLEMTMREFREAMEAGERCLYLQSPLVEGIGEKVVADFVLFDWEWVRGLPQSVGWRDLSSNLLLVGQKGNVTPAHYDEQQNLLAQLVGRKRVLLFPPEAWRQLYPYPRCHPHDRQTLLDFAAPDLGRFPRFAEARPLEAVLGPGDVLYIPQYWWHYVENLDAATVSVTFWHKDTDAGPVELPIAGKQELAVLRNLEKIVCEVVGVDAYHGACRDIDRGVDSPEAQKALATAKRLLAHVLPTQALVDAFIKDMVRSRFW